MVRKFIKNTKWCDEYFYLKHRDENRGVGGLFDDLNDWGYDKSFAFMKPIGDSFLDAYLPIAEHRKILHTEKRKGFSNPKTRSICRV